MQKKNHASTDVAASTRFPSLKASVKVSSKVSTKEPGPNTFSARERVIAAALKLFVEQGYFGTSIPDLSRASKCSIGSIYHNFRNKEEVAAAVYEEGLRAFRQALGVAVKDQKDPKQVIMSTVRSFLIFSERNKQLSKYLWLCRHQEFLSKAVRHPTRVGLDAFGRTLTRAVKDGIKKKLILPLKANILWNILFGIPVSYVRDWLEGYSETAPSAVAEELATACWRAISEK